MVEICSKGSKVPFLWQNNNFFWRLWKRCILYCLIVWPIRFGHNFRENNLIFVFSPCLVLKKVSKEQIPIIYTSILCSLDFLDLRPVWTTWRNRTIWTIWSLRSFWWWEHVCANTKRMCLNVRRVLSWSHVSFPRFFSRSLLESAPCRGAQHSSLCSQLRRSLCSQLRSSQCRA